MFVRTHNCLVPQVGCLITSEDEFRLAVGASLSDDALVRRIRKDDTAPLKFNLVGGKEYDRLFLSYQESKCTSYKESQLQHSSRTSVSTAEQSAGSALDYSIQQVTKTWHQALSSATYQWYEDHGDLIDNRAEMEAALRHFGNGHDVLHRNGRGIYYLAGASIERHEYFGRKNGFIRLLLALKGSSECGVVTIDSKDLSDDLRVRITLSPNLHLSRNRLRSFDLFMERQRPPEERPTSVQTSCKLSLYAFKAIHCLTHGRQAGDRCEYRLSDAEEISEGFHRQYSVRMLEFEDEPILRPLT